MNDNKLGYDKNKEYTFSPAEAAVYIGISEPSLANLRQAGKGPSCHKPTYKTIVYYKTDLDAWIKGESDA